jgi:hypothetical protein
MMMTPSGKKVSEHTNQRSNKLQLFCYFITGVCWSTVMKLTKNRKDRLTRNSETQERSKSDMCLSVLNLWSKW